MAAGRCDARECSAAARLIHAGLCQVCVRFFSPPFSLPPSLPLCAHAQLDVGAARGHARRVGRGQRPRLVPARALVALQAAQLAPHARTFTTHNARARIVGAGPLNRLCALARSRSSPNLCAHSLSLLRARSRSFLRVRWLLLSGVSWRHTEWRAPGGGGSRVALGLPLPIPTIFVLRFGC